MVRRLMILMIAVLGIFGSDAFAIYDAGTGRFMQRDSIGYADGSNLYQYTMSNPMKYLDPSGLKLVLPGSDKSKQRFMKALRELCPDADLELNGDQVVIGENSTLCTGEDDGENSSACECLISAINDDNKTYRIEAASEYTDRTGVPNEDRNFVRGLPPRWQADGGLGEPGDGSVVMWDEERDFTVPGTYSDPSHRPNGVPPGRVPMNDTMLIGHELCGHGVPGLNHPNDDTRYTVDDPVIQIENDIRDDLGPGYGTRTGNN